METDTVSNMKQELIVRQTHEAFTRDVNGRLANGWKVVPGTLVISGAATSVTGDSFSIQPPMFYFAVVVEI